ncbi:DMT family transporter [Simiduia curdlanivorans]|uniref:DMT family transporter n=1 Tax=Simiduia curdlanivorans TaxID=1492769 RepID=A0ABV8V284_9GAMM|nr:DMT family transporter [Simiduia curdlanivorans]MDN3638088.1 DMT family transporter [Simiduia curdlanivorans]
MGIRILLMTALALGFFAANSVLCRMALGDGNSDPYAFTILRLTSGALTLLVLYAGLQYRSAKKQGAVNLWQATVGAGSWCGGLSLFVYALCFSWAYLELETGTGALLLFGAVQITLIISTLWRGNRLRPQEWVGLLMAFSGLVYLMWPNLQTPAWKALVAMTLSGLAWGLYTLVGQKTRLPLVATMGNFIRSLAFCALLVAIAFAHMQISPKGIYLALLSGALASGLGYAIWYSALAGLSAIQAGVVQLLVPILAAIGGALFVFEPIELRLIIASIWVLGGIFFVLMAKTKMKSIV